MKPSVNIFKSNQPKMLSKREDKKSISLNWNSRLYFQLGVIVSLLAVFLIMESTIGLTTSTYTAKKDFYLEEPSIYNIILKDESPKPLIKPEKQIKKQQIIDIVTPIENTTQTVDETPVTPIDISPTVVTPSASTGSEKPDKTVPDNVLNVEFAPIFPGCESLSSNQEKIACMSSKVKSFIARKFNVDKFSDYDSGEKQRITVQFKIDENGAVKDILARAPDKLLEKEAIRVVNTLPKMEPGKQGDKNVAVLYTVPITLLVN